MGKLRMVNGNIYDEDYMTFDECIDLIKVLSYSQGMWGRLLRSINELDDKELAELKEDWESRKFTDNLDFILFIEN